MSDTIAMVVIVCLMLAFVLCLAYVTYMLFYGYFVTGEVAGVASSPKDLFGGVFFAACGIAVIILAVKMVRA